MTQCLTENIDKINASNTSKSDQTYDDLDLADYSETEVCMPTMAKKALTRANKLADNLAPKVNLILDSAATISVVSNLKYLQNIRQIDINVAWGNASNIKAYYKGDLYIKFNTG